MVFNDLARSVKSKYSFDEFANAFYGGNLDITIKTPDVVKHHWNPAHDYIVTEVPFDKATGIEFNEYHDEKDPTVIYRVAITTDENNNLRAFIAVPDITKLDDRELARMILAPLGEAITYANRKIPAYKPAPHFEPSVENFANESINTTYYLITGQSGNITPHFVFLRK